MNLMIMKTLRMLIPALCLAVCMPLMAQNSSDVAEVTTIDRHAAQAYRQGEVIVKFKPTSRVKVSASRTGAVRSNVNLVDSVFAKLGVTGAEQLMPLSGTGGPARVKSHTGSYIERADLSKLYRLQLNPEGNVAVYDAIDALKELPEVEFAEPNYLVYTLATPPADGDNDEKTYKKEPLFKEQWYFEAVHLNHLWTKEKITDKRPVIAIIDTGVDITHPDLADNIWTNEREANGAEGADDDSNGYKDDLHGWDFVNQVPALRDNNGHGTHVAGIAAAVGNNGIGIAGANPDALIMPITVLQSDGAGDIATVVKGIDYAAANGADVINMSLGTNAYSIAMEQALARAYHTAVLVAAAGNDCMIINPGKCPVCKEWCTPMFPAAFTFVLGVEASNPDGSRASFSNYDDDGPTFSAFSEEQLYNYELRAPGTSIMSTYPGGKYKALNGTSMASPLVAGAISRLLQCKEYYSKELLFGDLIHARKKHDKGLVDFEATYEIKDEDRKPALQLVTYALIDSIAGDGDNRPDAGETIELWPTFRNEWGNAENITFSLEVAELEDPAIIEIIDDNVSFGKNLSSYAKAKSEKPLRFKINDKCADGRRIRLVLRATCDNITEELVHEFTITAENGVELGGLISEDMTLYPNVHYIVTKRLAIQQGAVLTIKPGTVLKFKAGSAINAPKGTLNCVGNADSLIVFTMADNEAGYAEQLTFNDAIEYVKFDGMYFSAMHPLDNLNANNCIFENCYGANYLFGHGNLNMCNITGCGAGSFINQIWMGGRIYTNTNLIGNFFTGWIDSFSVLIASSNSFGNYIGDGRSKSDELISIAYNSETPQKYTIDKPNYLGSSREDILSAWVYDFYHEKRPMGYGVYDLSNTLTRPNAEAHGIVWKVVVNGCDAQDEFEMLPPLGVGKHKFEVYFSRPMDVSVAPNVYMGVRPPYTQVAIAEDGEWSADSLVYTAYLTVDGKTSSDGLNRIYVDGAKDTDHFEIPIENIRFNVEDAAAGSMATGLMAEAGLGKVTLTWETDEEDFEDLLGYNIYRYTDRLDSTYTNYDKNGNWVGGHWEIKGDTVIVNESVLESSEVKFTDYNVVPGTTYYYVIKQLTTSLNSHALSNAVAVTPLTAQKGDANGSMSVDVADVVTEVAYMSYQNPQPFIFEAADVNSDNKVNILDVVATVNIIRTPMTLNIDSENSTATYTIEDGILYIESDVAIGGIQLSIAAEKGTEFTPLEAITGFEQVGTWMSDSEYQFLVFSMSGKALAPGKHAILRIGEATLNDVILSNSRGANIMAVNGNTTGIGAVEGMQMRLPYPNPFSTTLTIPYIVGKDGSHNVSIVVSDIAGREVYRHAAVNSFGEYVHTWTPGTALANGLYIVSLYVDDALMQSAKVIYKK